MVWKFCGKAQFPHSFRFCIVSGDSPEIMRKLFLSTKLPDQEIRWNYGIFGSADWYANAVYYKDTGLGNLFSPPRFRCLWQPVLEWCHVESENKWNIFKKLKASLESRFSKTIFTGSFCKMRTKSESTWFHKYYLNECFKTIKMTSNSKQNRQKIQITERRKTRFLKEQIGNADL